MFLAHRTAIAAAVLISAAGTSQAAPTTFYGADLSNPANTEATSHPNADNARTMYLNNLSSSATNSFESFTAASNPSSLSFGAFGNATFSGSGQVFSGNGNGNRFPISGNNFYDNFGGSVTLTFSAPIAAFGFYATDVGDAGSDVAVLLTRTDGTTTLLTAPKPSSTLNSDDGSVLYFGFYDSSSLYKSISLTPTSAAAADFIGFDDFSVGALPAVVTPVTPSVPEPETLALLSIGTLGAGVLRRRKRG